MCRTSLLALSVFLAACGYIPTDNSLVRARWNLDAPIYVELSPTVPRGAELRQDLQNAISKLGGSVTQDSGAYQRVVVADNNAGPCSVLENGDHWAYADVDTDVVINFCHNVWVLDPIQAAYAEQVAMHELGHILAGHGGHPDCDPQHPQIMQPDIDCVPGGQAAQSVYQLADLHYICDSGNTSGGACGGLHA